MTQQPLSTWRPNFENTSPLFEPIRQVFSSAEFADFPDLAQLNSIFQKHQSQLATAGGSPIRFVPQADSAAQFEREYEPRIYLRGEIQTRPNWHDFFQVLVWSLFPRTKIELNRLHYVNAYRRYQQDSASNNRTAKTRSALENAITLFDECGAIVFASDQSLLERVRKHQWHDLFWGARDELEHKLKIHVFGHAMYEKALTPYIGMTCPSLIFHCSSEFMHASIRQQISVLDENVADLFHAGAIRNPRNLQPVPVLGYPGWHPLTQHESFYRDTSYFRPRSTTHTRPIKLHKLAE
jgi:hypothetical protein